LRLPHVLEVNAPLCDEARRFRTLPHPHVAVAAEKLVRAETDHIFANSDAMATYLVEAGVEPEKLTVVPNGSELGKFRQRSRRSGAVSLGSPGSLKAWPGVDVRLDAFTRAQARRPDLRLEIVGTGPEGAKIDGAAVPQTALLNYGALPHVTAI